MNSSRQIAVELAAHGFIFTYNMRIVVQINIVGLNEIKVIDQFMTAFIRRNNYSQPYGGTVFPC